MITETPVKWERCTMNFFKYLESMLTGEEDKEKRDQKKFDVLKEHEKVREKYYKENEFNNSI